LKSLARQGYNIAGIYPSRAHQGALTAKHTFAYILSYFFIFPPFQKDMELPQAETGKITGCARCRAASAFDAYPETRFPFSDKIGYMPAVGIIVNLTSF
jgi:hypothetical protein